MCYFNNSRVVRVEDRPINDAIVAWKKLKVAKTGELVSPMQGTEWSTSNFMRAQRMPYHRSGFGIYSFKTKDDARGYSGTVIVKLLIWGRVLVYAQRGTGKYGRPAGFVSQYAEVHEIHIPYNAHLDGLRQQDMLALWSDQGVKIVEGTAPARNRILVPA